MPMRWPLIASSAAPDPLQLRQPRALRRRRSRCCWCSARCVSFDVERVQPRHRLQGRHRDRGDHARPRAARPVPRRARPSRHEGRRGPGHRRAASGAAASSSSRRPAATPIASLQPVEQDLQAKVPGLKVTGESLGRRQGLGRAVPGRASDALGIAMRPDAALHLVPLPAAVRPGRRDRHVPRHRADHGLAVGRRTSSSR